MVSISLFQLSALRKCAYYVPKFIEIFTLLLKAFYIFLEL